LTAHRARHTFGTYQGNPRTTHPQPSHLDATSYPLVAQLLNRLDRAGPPHDIKARPASVRVLIRPADWRWGQQPKINSS